MARVPVSFGRRRPVPGRRTAGLVVSQLAAAVLVVVVGAQAAERPDGGLQQLDLLMLDERVPGLVGTGRPALVLAPGDLDDVDCRDELRQALALRERPGGLERRYDLVVVLAGDDVAAAAGLGLSLTTTGTNPPAIVRPDPEARLTRSLALEEAAEGCEPGYVVMSASGRVRYRTYDPEYATHGGEQSVLLQAVAGRDEQDLTR
jgi:hypothetical protein